MGDSGAGRESSGDTMKYIVKSGSGYFLRFINGTPEMISDPVSAVRLSLNKANSVIDKLDNLGFAGKLVRFRIGKYVISQRADGG